MERRHEEVLQRLIAAERRLVEAGMHDSVSFRLVDDFGGQRLEHPGLPPGVLAPAMATIEDMNELGLLRMVETDDGDVAFTLTMAGRSQAASSNESRDGISGGPVADRRVAVMHGRDEEATKWMFDWLRSIDLEPLEWGTLVGATSTGAPYNLDVVREAFEVAQAIVILVTPDDISALHPDLGSNDRDVTLEGQARLNVMLEAGMAFERSRDRTILVRIGNTRDASDLDGLNAVRLTNGSGCHKALNEIAKRLRSAGCPVKDDGSSWLDTDRLTKLAAHMRGPSTAVHAVRPRDTHQDGDRSPTAMAALGGNGQYRFFRSRGSIVEERIHDASRWLGWSSVGDAGGPILDLAASSLRPGHAEVFALLENGKVVHCWRIDSGGWTDRFHSHGNPFPDERGVRIEAASMREGHQEVFVESRSGVLAHLHHDGRRWCKQTDADSSLNVGWHGFPG